MMPIFKSIRAIPPTDLVSKFEHNPIRGSQVIVHTNIKKTKLELIRINPPENACIVYFDKKMRLLINVCMPVWSQQLIGLGPEKG